MTTLRRFLAVQVLLLWQGGFLFYAAFVVPAGTPLLGKAGQGAITARVTDGLNAVGAVGLVVLALELRLARDPNTLRTARRWWTWGVALVCHGLLIYLHMLLDAFMDDDRRRVVVGPPFYPVHRIYLWTSTVQWATCLLLTWWMLRAWRAEDESLANSGGAKHTENEVGREQPAPLTLSAAVSPDSDQSKPEAVARSEESSPPLAPRPD